MGTVITAYKTLTEGVGAWRWDCGLYEFSGGLRQVVLTGQRIGSGAAYDIELAATTGMKLLPARGNDRTYIEPGETITWRFDVPPEVTSTTLTVRWRNGVQRWRPLRSKRFTL